MPLTACSIRNSVSLPDSRPELRNAVRPGYPVVSRVDLVGHLVARELHLLGVDNDDVVTAIDVGGVAGLVLASEI